MRDNLTDITVILDRSGSMASVKDDTIGGLNTFIASQKALPGDVVFSMVQFDDQYELLHKAVAIKDVPKLQFEPRGMTALLDAIGRTIAETGERLAAMAEDDRPGKVVMVILTDGAENSSKEFTRPKVFEMITEQREKYQWQFMFLGANQDAIGAAANIGIQKTSAINFAANGAGVAAAFASNSNAIAAYRTCGTAPAYSQADRDLQDKLIASTK